MSWAAQARKACAASNLEPPQPHELENMYEDGLEPADSADPRVRVRYVHPPRRKTERSATDLDSEAMRRDADRLAD
jgi:hypothetical protein